MEKGSQLPGVKEGEERGKETVLTLKHPGEGFLPVRRPWACTVQINIFAVSYKKIYWRKLRSHAIFLGTACEY